METTATLLFSVLRTCIQGSPLDENEKTALSREALKELFSLSKKHDLAHLVAFALQKEGIPCPNALEQELFKAVYRQTQQDVEVEKIAKSFSDAHIPFLPLKGAVLRTYYPERWMRTGCDIDILVREEHVKKAAKLLKKQLQYRYEESAYHDLSLFSPSGVHLELHFSICEDFAPMDDVLQKVWEHSAPIAENAYRYRMSDTFLIFHTVAHTAYHFYHGGCGIRPFLDLHLLEAHLHPDPSELAFLLEEAHLDAFHDAMQRLLSSWFAGVPHTPLTAQMEVYILDGGVYGTRTQSILNSCIKKKGRFRFLLQRVFPPYRQMKVRYRAVRFCPILLPFFWVVRLMSCILHGRLPDRTQEIAVCKNVSASAAAETETMLRALRFL